MAGRETLPPQQFARVYRDERGKPDAQFDFVSFLDGSEWLQSVVFADENAFLRTVDRAKWDIAQR